MGRTRIFLRPAIQPRTNRPCCAKPTASSLSRHVPGQAVSALNLVKCGAGLRPAGRLPQPDHVFNRALRGRRSRLRGNRYANNKHSSGRLSGGIIPAVGGARPTYPLIPCGRRTDRRRERPTTSANQRAWVWGTTQQFADFRIFFWINRLPDASGSLALPA
jgi:hypothetical protein